MSINHAMASLCAVVDAVTQPLWVIDEFGAVAHVNDSAADVLGYRSQRQLVGLSSHDALHSRHEDGSPYPDRECPIVRAQFDSQGSVNREVFLTRSGRPLQVTWTLSTLPSGRHRLLAFSPQRQPQPRQSLKSGATPIGLELRAQIARDFHDPDLTPERLAGDNHISLRTLQSIFARDHDSPAALIRHTRLQHGRLLLRAGARSSTAAFECGFRDVDTFIRAFRREYGVTPKTYAMGSNAL